MGSGRLREFSLSNRDELRAGYKLIHNRTEPAITYTKCYLLGFLFPFIELLLHFQF